MKKLCLLILLSCCLSEAYTQNVTTLLVELDSAYSHSDTEEAKKLIAKITSKESKLSRSQLADFLLTSGSVFYSEKDYVKGIDFFSRAAEISKIEFGETEYHYPLAIFNLAACYHNLGRYTEAEPLYLQSLPGLAQAFGSNTVEYTRCFYSLASMYIDMGRYADAEGMCAAAVNFYKVALGNSSSEYLSSLSSMGIIYQGLGRYEKAEEIFLALLNYFSAAEVPDSATIRTLHNNLGELYRNMGDYERAESQLLQALGNSHTNDLSAASSLNNLALVQKALGKYSEAERSYKSSLSIYRNKNLSAHPDYTNPLNNLGELYRVMGRLQEAVDAFEEVISIRKSTLGTDHPNYANALNNIALVEFAIGQLDAAEQHLLECKEIYKKLLGEKDKLYANALNNLASVYKEKGELAKAEEHYLLCLQIFASTYGETSDKYGNYLGGLAGTYRKMKKYDQAIKTTERALEIIQNKLGKDHYDAVLTEYNLAETYREAGMLKDAASIYLRSVNGFLFLIERYFPALGEAEKTSFYYTVANAFETYNSFVFEVVQNDPSIPADSLIMGMFDEQLAIKSLLLKETSKVRNQVLESGNAQLIKDYKDLLSMREAIVQKYRLSPEDLADNGIDLPALEKEANALEQKLSTSLPSVKEKNISWSDVRSKLKKDECAVEVIRTQYYSSGEWTDSVIYAALVIHADSKLPELVMIRNGRMLEETGLPRYRNNIRSQQEDIYSYNAMWDPLKSAIGSSKKIFFSGDGAFLQVNLYTLKNPFTQKYLVEESDVVLLTSIRDLVENDKSFKPSNIAEIFSYPDYDLLASAEGNSGPLSRYGFTNLPELPGTKIEADTISKILRSGKWTVNDHLQADATEKNIKKVSSPKVLHIATHGFFLADVSEEDQVYNGMRSELLQQNPLLRSGLMLTGAAAIARDTINDISREDGILTASEAANLNLENTELVILSACETGLGELRNSQGVYGLQRAFMVAGSKSVVMSLWVVDDFATQELMSNFYREWMKDPSSANKHVAFRKAQLKLKEKFPAPYYWGAFVMLGQ
jgi:CHAT domain-containing protein/tetratricopeptide (TPR) repeat protein